MWIEKIKAMSDDLECSPGITENHIGSVEQELGVRFPESLRALLRETNGIVGEYGEDIVWPLERIREDNQAFRNNAEFRELYMPFDPLLFFGDAGNGDQFAFAICDDDIRRPDVFVWDHETDSRTLVAKSLEQYLQRWVAGDISL